MKKILVIVYCFVISGCSGLSVAEPTATIIPTITVTATLTQTLTPTKTPTFTPTPIQYNRFTVPFNCEDYGKVFILNYFDRDLREGYVRNYAGDTTPFQYWSSSSGTEDKHKGLDYVPLPGFDPSEIEIVAAEDGIVIGAGTDFVNVFANNIREGYVEIDHDPNTPRKGYVSGYSHVIPSVQIGQLVYRGDIIAVFDLRKARPMVDFSIWDKSGRFWDPTTHQWGIQVDIFRDVLNSNSISFWTVDNDPQCFQ